MSGTRARIMGAGVLMTLAALVLAQGRVALHSCVDAGGFAPFGLQFALLRDAAQCPAGTYGLGSTSTGAVLLLSIGLPALAAHLVLAACGFGFARAARACLGALAAAGRRALVFTVARVHVVVVRPAPVPVARAPRGATEHVAMLTWSHRGPPLAA
ncbi:MAG: hypothetical protein KJ792_11270 [Actinobacteria bacterium]|nr:hypothetical protein [Actinomycetota bacterium]MCG2802534.1 hypothetical protein [Cellulomonas sp.]